MDTVAIRITNETGLPGPQRYILFFGDTDGKVSSNSNEQLRSVVWFRSKELQNGQTDTARITREIYGFVGSTNVPSKSLGAGNLVDGNDWQEVEVARPSHDNGSELRVNPNESGAELEKLTDKTSRRRTFTIWTDGTLNAQNVYVTGVARKTGKGMKAVAAIPVIPGQQNVITPDLTLYVGRMSADNITDENLVVDGSKIDLKEKILLTPGQNSVAVSNQIDAANKNANIFKGTA